MIPANGSSQYEKRVQPRERHVRSTDHQRKHEVRQAGEHRDHEQEDQQRGVDREDAVVLRGGQKLHSRLGQLGADQHREQAPDEQEEERGDRVLDPDHLVVGVDLEVVPPGVGAVGRVLLGARRLARSPVEPVVGGADPDEEEQRHGDQRDDRDRVGIDHRVLVHRPADQDRQAKREGEADHVEQRRPVPARRAQLRRKRHARARPLCDRLGSQGR